MTDSVDVIQAVCSKDPSDHLKESIESMLDQTYPLGNYILVRDGVLLSTQIRVLEKFNHHLKIIDNTRKRGLAGSLNTAILFSSADILVRMDSDDLSMQNRIEKLVEELTADRELLVIGSAAREFDSEGNLFFTKKMPEHPDDIVTMALTRSPFIHSSIAFRRRLFEIVGLYNENYLKAQDYELWARVIINYPSLLTHMKNIHLPLIAVRLTDEFWSNRSVNNIRYGTPISLRLIRHLKAYHKTPLLFLKVLLRLSPNVFKKFSYKYFR